MLLKPVIISLLAVLCLSSVAQATPGKAAKADERPGKPAQVNRDDRKPAAWDEQEYGWWEKNCIDIKIGSVSLKNDCERMDGKYRDHYNRSIHSGNNPGRGHKK